jgi:hypothetical protein
MGVGITGISSKDLHVERGGESHEHAHARMLNTGRAGVGETVEFRGSTLGAIAAVASMTSAMRLDFTHPMLAKDNGNKNGQLELSDNTLDSVDHARPVSSPPTKSPAALDIGATSHCMKLLHAPCAGITKAMMPIAVHLPYKITTHNSHEGYLNLPPLLQILPLQ